MKGFKKMGLMFMAMVIALVGVGVGYAAWTDTITISGTVNTGDVDLVIEYLSTTEVWKDLDTDGNVTVSYIKDADTGAIVRQDGVVPQPGLLVAYGNTTAVDVDGDTITFEFDNLFPSIDFWVDAKLHYAGSIPVKINDISWQSSDTWINHLISGGDIELVIKEWDPQSHRVGDVLVEGDQLHYCDWIWVGVRVHIPQEAHGSTTLLQDRDGSFTVTLEVVQWNEYPH